MNCNCHFYKWVIAVFALLYSSQIQAEVRPVLFKDEPELYSKIYFGMSYAEFKTKLGSNIFECKDSTNKNVADKGCKVSFKFSGSSISDAVVMFKNEALIAVLGRINTEQYDNVVSKLSATYKDQPQLESRDVKKGLFSKKVSNKYSIWSYPEYLIIVSKFDIAKYEDSGTNFLFALETTNNAFITQMMIEAKKKSNIDIQTKAATIDFSKQILSSESQLNLSEKKTETLVTSSDPIKPIEKNKNSINSVTATQPTIHTPNQKTAVTDRSLLTSDLSYGTKKEQLNDKVAFCSSDDKFLTELHKNFPKYGVDEYCVGSNLVKDIQANTLFLLKDGLVKSVIHQVNLTEFRKLSLLYKNTFGNEPKNKQTYKGLKSVSCFSDEGLTDYVEFCKQEVDGFVLATGNVSEINVGLQNRIKFAQTLRSVSANPPNTTAQIKALAANDTQKADDNVEELAKNNSFQKKKSNQSNKKWEQEPTSFMGIELGQPLSKNVSTECPKNFLDSVDESAADSLGRLCHSDDILKISGSYSVYGFQVPPLFKNAYIKTLDGKLDGAVGTFEASFNSSDFSQVMEMLTIKYGSPHKREVEKLKTKGGAEFDNIVLSWSGGNVLIKVESLAGRGFSGSSLYELGVIKVFTSEYLTKKSKSSSEAAQKGAEGL